MLLKVIGNSSLTSVLSIQSSSSKARKVMFLALSKAVEGSISNWFACRTMVATQRIVLNIV
ncbi:hypothetical protein NC651_027426 [Populus alba x Populus x berolinensis]|nr:hypothetical protein NC651_027426 [Populus alba x Populus x berolinensis]